MTSSVATRPARVFCSYSHRDDEFREELERHLSTLTRQHLITFWYDRRLVPGDEWKTEIASELDEADIILLLISSFFISSDYCYQIELGRALQRHDEGGAVVIPIFVRACDWEGLGFSRLQGLPPGARPVNDFDDHDVAWVQVTRGIRQARDDLIARGPRSAGISSLSTASRAEVNTYEVGAYLRHLLTGYQREPWTDRVISLEGEIGGRIVPLDRVFDEWLADRVTGILLLTGAAGMGKTWALRRFAAVLAERGLAGETRVPQPLFVPFRSLEGSDGIAAVARAVPEAHGVLDRLRAGAATVILLDGIDEVPAEALEGAVRLIDRLERTAGGVRVAVSCRTHVAPRVTARLGAAGQNPLTCRIRELTAEQIREYLGRSGAVASVEPAAIGVMRNPIVLRMFEEALPQMPVRRALGFFDIYESSIKAALAAGRERERRLAVVSQEELLSALTGLAGQMFPRLALPINRMRRDGMSSARFLDIVNGLVATGLLALDTRERVSFGHVSFSDYFLARLLHDELGAWNAAQLSIMNLITEYTVNRFLVPMLLRDPRPLASRGALSMRQQLSDQVETTSRAAGAIVTPLIRRRDFVAFVEDTGWRHSTGFGQWVSFIADDGTLAASDRSILPDPDELPLVRAGYGDHPAVSLSWYDAHQFAHWIGGRLPTEAELRPIASDRESDLQWTSDWFDESQAQILIISCRGRESQGVNPDVRSKRIGFRVTLL